MSRLGKRIESLNNSINGRILTAAITVAAMTAAVKAAAMLKDMVLAHRFGAGDALDAFFVALLLPNFLSSTVGESFGASFIPVYIELRETQGNEAAQRTLSSLACCALAAFMGLALALAAVSGVLMPLLGSGFEPAKIAWARALLLPLLLWLGLCGVNALWHAALNTHDRFGISALAPILTPLLIIATLLAGASWGVQAVSIGTCLGGIADLLLCGLALRRLGISVVPRWYGASPALFRVLGQFAPMVGGALLMGSATVVDQAMAGMLGSGSVAALNYGGKLLTLPMWVGVNSLSVAVFPGLSRLSAKSDWAGMRHVLRTYAGLTLLISIPITLVLVRYSDALVALVFQRGAFTAQDARLVAQVQAFLSLQLPFYALGILYVRALSALKHNQVLMWGTVINVTLNAALNAVFMRIMGLPGIALSTSVVYIVSCAYLWFCLERRLSERESQAVYPACEQVPVLRASDC